MLQATLPMAVLLAAGSAWASAQGGAPGPGAPPALWSDAEKEGFLLEADVVRRKGLGTGITNSQRATLRRHGVEHDAHVQTIDEYKPQVNLTTGVEIDFRDSWRNNVAAYRLDRLLGLGMVPVTVARRHDLKMAAYTWWVDDVAMTEGDRHQKKVEPPDVEAWNRRMFVVRVFDQLIYNVDRNLGNLLIDKDWTMWMIDHTRAFKIFDQLKSEKNLGTTCARDLLPALRRLDKATLAPPMKGLLTEGQIDALLRRRDRIVRYYESRIATAGEDAVLYDLPRRPDATPPLR
jgi:hypothetical protein